MNRFKRKKLKILTFYKWGRKSYSAFNTLSRVIKIAVLSVTYFLATPQTTLAVKQDTSGVDMKFDLEEIEVSAQRSPALYSQVARIVSVVDLNDIEAAPVKNIHDLLEYVAGVDVRQRGAEGVQADISIRGGTFDQTLILLNGINITDPQTGHHNLNLPVSLEQVERIEILEGPAARVYGPNAFSGAVNIVTKSPGTKQISLKAGGGSFGYFNGNFSGGFKTGNLGHLIAFDRKRSDGYITNTDFEISNLFYSNHLVTKKGNLSFQVGLAEKAFGANSFYTPVYPNQFEETRTIFSALKWQGEGFFHLTPVIYFRLHQDRFELYREDKYQLTDDGYHVWEHDTIPPWYQSHNYHLTDVYGSNVNSWVQWKLGTTALGVDFRSENILSNVLGEEMDSPSEVPGEDAEFTKSKSRNTWSAFLEHVAYVENWTFSGGLMTNHISESNSGWNVFPGIEISYNLNEYLDAFSSFNTSLRMPTFTDLYYDGPTNIGNPDLKPEKSASVEGGLKLSGNFFRGHLVIFCRNGKNIIDWVKMDEEDEVWQPQNLTHINSLGSELQVEFKLNEQFGNHLPDKLSLSYFSNNLEKVNRNFISNYVLDNLKHKLVMAVDQKLLKNLSLNIRVAFQDREGTFSKYINVDESIETEYEPFWIFDGKLIYEHKNVSVFASVNNIFNLEYYDIGNVVQPGRWLKFGAAFNFNLE